MEALRYSPDDPELYRHAAGIVIRRGWWGGGRPMKLGQVLGQVCVGQAVLTAGGLTTSASRIVKWEPIRDTMKSALGVDPVWWNDNVCQSQGECVEALTRVAKWCEEQREQREAI